MEALRSVVASLCVSFVFFGVIMMLTPSGTMQKNIKTFVSIAIVSVAVAVISGVSIGIGDFNINYPHDTEINASELNSTVNELNVTATESAIRKLVAETLKQRSIKYHEIIVIADIFDDTSISITETEIVCPVGQGDACRSVLRELGLNGKVTEREG